ncbi:MAG: SMP-30/gluconolactonase/LRE family protein [Rhizobacter sp.]|nr:SMP-30/gluconolactonase/LRE family protein [Rhizobacter sp.]
MNPQVDVLCNMPDQVGESPLWSVAEQALYWVDIEGRAVRRYDWHSDQIESWPTAERIGCIALHEQGGLVAGMESGLFHLRLFADSKLDAQRLVAVSHPRAGMRFNDGRCDRQGRFWAGTMVLDMSLGAADGALFRFDRRGLSKPLVDGLITPNGLAFGADGRTMYLSDSHPSRQQIWRFDLDADGTPTDRRLFVDMTSLPGRPDGAAMDSDGGYWVCGNDAGQVHRFTPDGRLDRSITVPVSKPAMCAFGGPQLDWLFITSIRPAQPPPGQQDLAGALFATRPGATGLAEVAFSP